MHCAILFQNKGDTKCQNGAFGGCVGAWVRVSVCVSVCVCVCGGGGG